MNYVKATLSPALNIEAGILPLKLHLELLIGDSLLRLATSAKYSQFTQTRSKRRLRKVTPLEALAARFEPQWKITLESIEKIAPFITPPWTDVPKIHIEQDKTQAKTSHERLLSMPNTTSASYYTDGSDINQKVGAAAVQIGHNSQNVLVFLGSTSCYTVYAAELSGILVVLHMAAANRSISQTVLIFSDNQSALQSIGRPGTTSGQIIIRDILDVIQKLRARRIEIQFYWVPACTGIAGNEKADKVAKESTGWRTETKRHG